MNKHTKYFKDNNLGTTVLDGRHMNITLQEKKD